MFELAVAALVAAFIGGAVGYQAKPKEPAKYVEPRRWHPDYHADMIRICGMECKVLRGYNARTGECSCYKGKGKR